MASSSFLAKIEARGVLFQQSYQVVNKVEDSGNGACNAFCPQKVCGELGTDERGMLTLTFNSLW